MSQVNLLPPDIREGQRTRRVTGMVILAGLVLLAVVFGFYLLQVQQLSSVKDDIRAQESSNAQIQGDIDDLQRFEDLQVRAQQAQGLLASAYASEVSLSGLLMDMSRVTPTDSYLDNLSITINPPPAADQEPAAVTFAGTMSLSGQAIGFDTLSVWLTRLEQVEGWVNAWMSTISQAEPALDSYTFAISVDLAQDVITGRGRGAVPGEG